MMISTLLVAGAGRSVDAVLPQALRVATELIGTPPSRVLALPGDTATAAGLLSSSAVTLGKLPLAARVVNSRLQPALLAAGATCLAPGLHLTMSRRGPDRVLTTYADFWRPVIGALIGIGRQDREQAA